MRSSRRYLTLVVSFVASWIALCVQASADGGRLHVILAIDSTSPDIRLDMRSNGYSLSQCIKQNVPRNRLNIVFIDDMRLNAANILRQIENLDVNSDDAILFYYSGHGFYETGGRGTFITPPPDGGNRFYLSTVDRALEAKHPRFRAVIFDCCSVTPEGPLAHPAPIEQEAAEISPLFQSLFFDSQGSVILVSSKPGEYALCHVPLFGRRREDPSFTYGSLFTGELLAILGKSQEEKSWETVCPELRKNVSAAFQRIAKNGAIKLGSGRVLMQNNQTVVARIDYRPI